mmetsp:Transcript_6457/g.19104  ORF Transcript_6457/g.19104 Transcript_6457/m.19104 type:complete len:95 (-) Transcript_6457:152-436(-)
MADTKEESAPPSTSEHINIRVKQDDNEITFKIKKTTPLKKLMNAYCNRQNLELSQIVFLYEGERIQAEQTPEQLNMSDDDEIDAMIHQVGGRRN